MHFLFDYHLCVDLVGLLRQLPAFSVQSVSRSDPYARSSDVATAVLGCKYIPATTSHNLIGTQIGDMQKRLEDIRVSQVKFATDLVEETRKALSAEMDHKVTVVRAELQ